MIAVSVGTGVGINSLLSHHGCGRRTVDAHRGHPVQTKNQDRVKDNFEDANATAENGLVLAVISAALFALFGGLFSILMSSLLTGIVPILFSFLASIFSFLSVMACLQISRLTFLY